MIALIEKQAVKENIVLNSQSKPLSIRHIIVCALRNTLNGYYMHSITDEQLQQAYRYAVSLTNDRDIARDIVHSVYTKMLEKGVAGINNTQSYFLRCIRNAFIDQKRFDDRWLMVDDECEDNTYDLSLTTLESTTIHQNILQKLWATFKPMERELLYLWAVEEYTIDEISTLTNTSRGTLLSRIYRIRKKVSETEFAAEVPHENTA